VQEQSVFVWYTKIMQKIATRIFIYASIAFGVVGMLIVLTASGPDKPDSPLSEMLIRLLFATVFIILPSFALSIAGKYLDGKSK
jgi:Na+/H+ antiporter NhaA